MAYTLLAERVEARALNGRLVAAAYLANGGTATMPDPDDDLAAFDAALVEPPERMNSEQGTLLLGLGLRGR